VLTTSSLRFSKTLLLSTSSITRSVWLLVLTYWCSSRKRLRLGSLGYGFLKMMVYRVNRIPFDPYAAMSLANVSFWGTVASSGKPATLHQATVVSDGLMHTNQTKPNQTKLLLVITIAHTIMSTTRRVWVWGRACCVIKAREFPAEKIYRERIKPS
jgi:hypothetical protein